LAIVIDGEPIVTTGSGQPSSPHSSKKVTSRRSNWRTCSSPCCHESSAERVRSIPALLPSTHPGFDSRCARTVLERYRIPGSNRKSSYRASIPTWEVSTEYVMKPTASKRVTRPTAYIGEP
jgi:hypothetical protein